MSKPFITFLCLFFNHFFAFAQCNIDLSSSGPLSFSTVDGTDIVNGVVGGANTTSSQSFNIWDEINNDCNNTGGADDVTIEFEILHTIDHYGVDGVIDFYAGDTHEIVQSATGLQGSVPLGTSTATESSTADLRGYNIKVTFAPHVVIIADDLRLITSSINSTGEAFETASVIYFDENGTHYGSANFDGFYDSGALPGGASNDNSCTAPASVNPWNVSGTGYYTNAQLSTVDMTAPCHPVAGTPNPNDDKMIEAVLDGGLNTSDRVGGFIFTIYVEDVAASSAPGANTSTSTTMSSTLEMIVLKNVVLPVVLTNFVAEPLNEDVKLSWQTQTETNHDHWEVEYSSDGLDFYPAGTVTGRGNSTSIQTYDFIHRDVGSGVRYYRLKQVDFNGNYNYSEIKTVKISNDSKVSLFPSVAREQINLIIPDHYQNVKYTVLDMNGHLVLAGDLSATQNNLVDIGQLNSGTYIIRLQSRRQFESLRFIKMKN